MNASENLVRKKLEDRGFIVMRNGWPDFLCARSTTRASGADYTGRQLFSEIRGACAIEVKTGGDRLSDAQKAVHAVLKASRIPVYVVRPEDMDSVISGSKRRLFLTDAEVKHLRDMAEKAHQRANQLSSEIDGLRSRVAEINAMIGTAGSVLDEAAIAIEELAPPRQEYEFSESLARAFDGS